MKMLLTIVSVLLLTSCGTDNIKTHSSHPKARRNAADTTSEHSRSMNKENEVKPESEVKFTSVKTELTVSIPQTIFKNLQLEIVAENPKTLTEVTEFINDNLENLRYIASDADLKSELDRLLREKFNGEASITVKGNQVVQPIDSTKLIKPAPKTPVVEDTRKYHIVQQGEGFLSIARKYKVNVNDLYRLNPGKKTLTKGNKIRIK